MQIQFNIHFKTLWGEIMCLMLRGADNSIGVSTECVAMQCNERSEWSVSVHVDKVESIHYQYAIKKLDNTLCVEFGEERTLFLNQKKTKTIAFDSWRSPYGNSPFVTTAFKDCFFKRTPIVEKKLTANDNFILNFNCPQLEPTKYLAIIGNQDVIGNWDVTKKVRLNETHSPLYSVSFKSSEINFPLEYKYLLVDSLTDEIVMWEEGQNRFVWHAGATETTILNDENFNGLASSWKTSGVAIPVFSLRSDEGFGIGEFNDLKKMVDWAKKTGQRIIQTLPINDTISYHTNADSYPYNAVSVYALHPIYLHLESLGTLKSQKQNDYFNAKKLELNSLNFVDYKNVIKIKWEYFRAIYNQEAKVIFDSPDYQSFFHSNKEWLVPYAVFSYLRDLYATPDFSIWPNYRIYNSDEVSELTSLNFDEIALYYFLQYHLHKQLVEVHDYAKSNGIAFKGDIPIGVSPLSVDAWVDPQLFNLQVQAGAPPDDFSATGQNWGFPTYNWELMEKDGFQWWKKRFQKLAEYFDAYRIDHILGFFRIWEIPIEDVWGLKGCFHPALPFTKTELNDKGLYWDEDRYLKPYLKEHVLYETFGEYTQEIIQKYLEISGWQSFKFKFEYNSQRKIEEYFEKTLEKISEKEAFIRDGLYMLHSEVIFVTDLHDANKFHPRISMHSSATFRDLPENTRRLLDQIYIDYFYHRHNEYWKQQAMKKLPALIKATNMLVCGEDLGMVPDSVPEVMNALEVLTLEIQRMPKKPHQEFGLPSEAPYRSVCTTSTHDMNPIRAWWEEDRALTQRYYNNVLWLEGEAPTTCESWIAERIITQHLDSNAMLIILPWQDWMSIEEELCLENPVDERINVPSNPDNFWCYRMHISLDQLLNEDKFNSRLKKMIKESGR